MPDVERTRKGDPRCVGEPGSMIRIPVVGRSRRQCGKGRRGASGIMPRNAAPASTPGSPSASGARCDTSTPSLNLLSPPGSSFAYCVKPASRTSGACAAFPLTSVAFATSGMTMLGVSRSSPTATSGMSPASFTTEVSTAFRRRRSMWARPICRRGVAASCAPALTVSDARRAHLARHPLTGDAAPAPPPAPDPSRRPPASERRASRPKAPGTASVE